MNLIQTYAGVLLGVFRMVMVAVLLVGLALGITVNLVFKDRGTDRFPVS